MVPAFRLVGPPDPCLGWDGTTVVRALPASSGAAPRLEGAFAGLGVDADGASLVRDPLGLGKLFWVDGGGNDDEIELAARPERLTDRGHALDDCYALPANTLTAYSEGAAPTTSVLAAPIPSDDDPGVVVESLETIAARIRTHVERYVAAVLAARPGPAVVCLSGGLDSTSVAALVHAHRPDAVAVTFDLDRSGRRRSDDLLAAETAARHLGMTLVPAIHAPERLLGLLDTVLVAGIDWRDFNVHAGLVNAGLAQSICALVGADQDETTVFTGDLVNEFLADYHSENYDGRTYYRLPRLSVGRTRDALVRGLATSHREIGVFADFGLAVVQPYAVAREDFLTLPEEILGPGPGKSELYRIMFGDDLPPSSYDRPKTRAQTGSQSGDSGVLAVCADAGLDEDQLARRFAELHGVDDLAVLRRFLRAGRYRTAVPLTEHSRVDPFLRGDR